MTGLKPGMLTDAAALDIPLDPVAPDQIVSGSPSTGYIELEAAGIGVWEMTPGVMRDVEADEVFVVLTGDATVDFVEPALASIDLRPGSVARLTEGMRTVWTVRETLRKAYLPG